MPSAPRDNFPLAIIAMMLGVSLAAGMDAAGKILLESLTVAQVSWGRFMFHTLWLTPAVVYVVCKNKTPPKICRREIVAHGGRGLLLVLSTFFFFTAIRDNPIPDSFAVFSVQPLVVMLMAAFFLGEPLHRRRLAAGGVAFIGVLVVLRPGGDAHYRWTIVFALLASISFAGYIIATRAASLRGSALTTAWATGLAGLCISIPFAVWYWKTPDEKEWWLLLLLGALAGGGHYLITLACRMAHASLVAIFQHTEIIATSVISYFVFRYVPDIWVLGGFCLIAGAKIGVTLLEIKAKSSARTADDKQPPGGK